MEVFNDVFNVDYIQSIIPLGIMGIVFGVFLSFGSKLLGLAVEFFKSFLS